MMKFVLKFNFLKHFSMFILKYDLIVTSFCTFTHYIPKVNGCENIMERIASSNKKKIYNKVARNILKYFVK